MPKLRNYKALAILITGIYFPIETLASQAAAVQPELSLTSNLLKTFGMLALVIALIYGLAWCLRKSQKNMGSDQRHLSLIETLPLGRNERVCLVKSGDRYLLLGVTPQGVNRIDEIPADSIPQTDIQRMSAKNSWQWAQQILHRH